MRPWVIIGPTASGKSAISLALARYFPIEIISMDSALVYRGMDIGAAKPTQEERQICPHHLIDIRDIHEPYSAQTFVDDTLSLVRDIEARGHIPVIVGGTLLYFKALMEGFHELPSTDPAVRDSVQAQAKEKGWPQMHALLMAIDPETASRLAPLDQQRISRAMEIYRMTGRTMSDWLKSPKAKPDFEARVLSLLPPDRARLHERIALRFEMMVRDGFLDEVKRLMQHPHFEPDLPSMRAVGYRQAIHHLQGETDFDTFMNQGIAATRQLAKRQMTWMRGMEGVMCFDPDSPETLNRVLALASEDGWTTS